MVVIITLYEKDATTFTDNGLCVLSPTSCIVTEVAGGEYELELEHPLDESKKYTLLTEERLIKAPVPKTVIPATEMPELKQWKVTTATDLYSRTPSATFDNTNWELIAAIKRLPMNYVWTELRFYNQGAICLYNDYIYQALKSNIGMTPSDSPFIWGGIGSINQSAPTYDAGTIIESLPVNTVVFKIADKGSYMQVRTTHGKVGFVLTSNCTETTEREQETLPEKTITEQVFRIYETSCDEETNTYTVKAKHISYDFMANCLYDCKITEASPIEAIAAIQGSIVNDDDRRIACNITDGKITQDWSFKNPVNAILDPDSGLVGKLRARLVRDNNDFYILDSAADRQGITISYGVNMLGVNWTRSVENVVARIIPRSGSSDKGYTYISDGGAVYWDTDEGKWAVRDDGEDYVESPIAQNYQVPRIVVMNCSYAVGQQYEAPDGTKKNYTKEEVLAKMKNDAMEQFTKDKVDGAEITLEVEFLLLGDTEEYKQYKDLQWVSLYDIVKVKTGKSQFDAEAQVTEYEYDCLRKRYNSIKLGKVLSFNKRIAAYRFVNGSITYDKLSPDLINRIVTGNASATTDSGSAAVTPTGGAETIVSPNTVSTDGIVTKGQGQSNKVWKTDADGNPAWRDDDHSVTVTDNDPTLSWGTRSAVGSIAGTDIHVTMPSNPDTWRPVQDNLTSTSTTDSLSANQGRVLNEKLADVNAETLTSGVKVSQRNGVVLVGGTPTISSPAAGTWHNLGTIPSSFPKPKQNILVPAVLGSSANALGVVQITTSGAITCYTPSSASIAWFSISY